MTRLHALIADDDPLVRAQLRAWLAAHADISVVGEAANGDDASRAILTLRPDLVLLDVQMPRGNGFEVVRAVGAGQLPSVVFLTAPEDGLTEVFEGRAVDYLLKPLDRDRVMHCVGRARHRLRAAAPGGDADLLDFVRALRPERVAPDQVLLVRSAGRIVFIQPDEIDWIDASGNYVRLHLSGTQYRVRETMDGIERKLDPRRFLRIHRSRIVNVSRIRELQHFADGHHIVVLRDGSPMRLGRTYRRRLKSRLDPRERSSRTAPAHRVDTSGPAPS